ncbi:MAG: class I SAM-dependent methyltransferase [Candidatus Pacearchaeota archaeon]
MKETKEIEKVKRLTKKVEGWLSDNEGELLYNLAKNCKGKGVIVEIGSWKGKSTIWLAKGSQAGPKVPVYAIDPHTGSSEHKKAFRKVWTFEEFKRNIRRVKVDDIVVPIVKTSKEAAKDFDKPIELIFIDGAHEYEFVKKDFELWFPKVVDGGVMAFHDTIAWPGPRAVVDKFVYKSRYFKSVKFIDSITFAQKGKNSLSDRIKNRQILLFKKIYELSSKLPLPKSIKKFGKAVLKFLKI